MYVLQQTADAETKVRRGEITWAVQALSSMIANTVEDAKGREQLIKQAQKFTLLSETDMEQVDDTSFSESKAERTLEDIMENGNVEEALRKNSQRKGPGLPFIN